MPTVLIVDDEMDLRTIVRLVLESAKRGIRVLAEAVDGDHALSLFEAMDRPEFPDVVILDNRTPGRNGIEIAEQILEIQPDQHIILYSAFLTPELEDSARAVGVKLCVSKGDHGRLPDLVVQVASEDPG